MCKSDVVLWLCKKWEAWKQNSEFGEKLELKCKINQAIRSLSLDRQSFRLEDAVIL